MTDSLDFALPEDAREAAALVSEILSDLADVERVRRVEAQEDGHDRQLWSTLAKAGVLAVPVPEEFGGSGLGLLGAVAMLEQVGRFVAPVRVAEILAQGVLPLARFGTPQLRRSWLEPMLESGEPLVTGAVQVDALGAVRVASARRSGDGWTLSGRFTGVPAAAVADALLIPFATETGGSVAVVATTSPGVKVVAESVTDRGSSATVLLEDVEVGSHGLLDTDALTFSEWVLQRARIARAAVQTGICDEALRMTAQYTSNREQFGRPLSTNQAVAVRAADAAIDTDCIRLTTRRAAWLIDEGREDEARSAALVSAWWAARAGLRVVHATQHLHGGIGADVDYPIHRYFLWGRQIAFELGSAAQLAAELGNEVADAPPIGAPA